MNEIKCFSIVHAYQNDRLHFVGMTKLKPHDEMTQKIAPTHVLHLILSVEIRKMWTY